MTTQSRFFLADSTSYIPRISSLAGALLISALLLTACGSGGGGGSSVTGPSNGEEPSVAAKTTALASGDPDCPAGGILVETGIDENKNGVLDDSEVDDSQKVCNGAAGLLALQEQQGLLGQAA